MISIIVKCSNVEISVYDNAITLIPLLIAISYKAPITSFTQESYLSDFRLSDFRLRTSQTFEILVQRQARPVTMTVDASRGRQALSGVSSAEGGSGWRTNPNAYNCAANSGETSQSE